MVTLTVERIVGLTLRLMVGMAVGLTIIKFNQKFSWTWTNGLTEILIDGWLNRGTDGQTSCQIDSHTNGQINGLQLESW